jgi:hypothetical protein
MTMAELTFWGWMVIFLLAIGLVALGWLVWKVAWKPYYSNENMQLRGVEQQQKDLLSEAKRRK